jgi:hypothetical protein
MDSFASYWKRRCRASLFSNPLTKRIKRGVNAPAHPTWLRMLALVCLLVVGFASSAQAAHIHGQWLPHQSTELDSAAHSSQLPGSEINCPLCVAMHLSMPVSEHLAPVGLVLVECRLAAVIDRVPISQWHFAMFSRPPPAETL